MDTVSRNTIDPSNGNVENIGIGLFSLFFGGAGLGGGSNKNGGGSNQYEIIKFGLTIVIVTWFIALIRSYLYSIFELIKNRFYFTAKLSYPDSMFVYFLEWLSSQNTLFGTRGVSVMTHYQNIEADDGGKMDIRLLPIGTQWLLYKGKLISIVRETANRRSFDGIKDDHLEVTVYGGDKSIITNLLETAIEYSVNLNKDKTKIYSLDGSATFWECIACQNKRLIDSVFLNENVSDIIVNDLSNFTHGKQWYLDTGVPYRRGYLLYGPPGSGKTSFILAIAGHFNKSISIMNMSKGIHDGNIHSIIQKCNKDTILVLEDIDAVFVKRKNQGENNVLTFSALLNAIDGLASSDGRILMMTTNHLERLSPALIRPGRIDIKVKFDYASSHQIELMFKRFFDSKYHYMINDIISKLSNHSISTAQLQGWFIIHRENPTNLLPNCDEFLNQCLSEVLSDDKITKDMLNNNNNNNNSNNKNNSNNNNSSSNSSRSSNISSEDITDDEEDDDNDDVQVEEDNDENDQQQQQPNHSHSIKKKQNKDKIKKNSILLSALSPSNISNSNSDISENEIANEEEPFITADSSKSNIIKQRKRLIN